MTTDTQRLVRLETDVAEIKMTVARLDGTMTDIKDLLKTLAPMLIASSARGEEQSKRIDDLSRAVAANTPQRIAAVGSDR
jgi:ribosomal protein L12E/L44/L45/RPP1/RPP2